MRRTAGQKKQEWLDRLKEARRSFLDAARAVPLERQDEVFLGVWSVKDLLAHLIGWDHTNYRAIQEILAGEAPDFLKLHDKDWQTYNRQLVEQHRVELFSALLVAAEESHRRLVGFLESLPANDIVYGKGRSPSGRTITIRNLLFAETEDEFKHAGQVQDFLFETRSNIYQGELLHGAKSKTVGTAPVRAG